MLSKPSQFLPFLGMRQDLDRWLVANSELLTQSDIVFDSTQVLTNFQGIVDQKYSRDFLHIGMGTGSVVTCYVVDFLIAPIAPATVSFFMIVMEVGIRILY